MTTRTRKPRAAKAPVTITIRIARRCTIDGYATDAFGGIFQTTLEDVLDVARRSNGGRPVQFVCQWLADDRTTDLGVEQSWLDYHYPGRG